MDAPRGRGRARRETGKAAVRIVTVAGLLAAGLLALPGPARGGPPPHERGNVVWKQAISAQGAMPVAVGNGMVYATAAGSQVVALDAKTGRLRWRYTAHDTGPMIPTVAGDRVLVTTESCTLYTLSAQSGNELWSRWLGDPIRSSPAVAQGHVYVASNGHKQDFWLVNYTLGNGSVVGTAALGPDVLGAPVVTRDAVYVTTAAQRLRAIDRASGRQLWETPAAVASMPVFSNGRIYAAATHGQGLVEALNARTGENPRRFVSSGPSAGPGTASRGAADDDVLVPEIPAVVEEQSRPAPVLSTAYRPELTPAVAEGRVVAPHAGGGLACMAETSGEVVWTAGAPEPEDPEPWRSTLKMPVPAAAGPKGALGPQWEYATPTIVGGCVYVGTRSGHLFSYDAATGEELWQTKLDGAITSPPAAVGGFLYVACGDGAVYCIETLDPKADGWPMWGGGPAHAGPEK